MVLIHIGFCVLWYLIPINHIHGIFLRVTNFLDYMVNDPVSYDLFSRGQLTNKLFKTIFCTFSCKSNTSPPYSCNSSTHTSVVLSIPRVVFMERQMGFIYYTVNRLCSYMSWHPLIELESAAGEATTNTTTTNIHAGRCIL
jgi:hypothetical protein